MRWSRIPTLRTLPEIGRARRSRPAKPARFLVRRGRFRHLSCPNNSPIPARMPQRLLVPEAFASALLVVFSVIYLLCPREATAQEGQQPQASEKPPEYQKLRYDEDYSYLKDPSKRSDLWDPIKYIPFNYAGNWYLSLGGEGRLRYELYHNF